MEWLDFPTTLIGVAGGGGFGYVFWDAFIRDPRKVRRDEVEVIINVDLKGDYPIYEVFFVKKWVIMTAELEEEIRQNFCTDRPLPKGVRSKRFNY